MLHDLSKEDRVISIAYDRDGGQIAHIGAFCVLLVDPLEVGRLIGHAGEFGAIDLTPGAGVEHDRMRRQRSCKRLDFPLQPDPRRIHRLASLRIPIERSENSTSTSERPERNWSTAFLQPAYDL